MDSTLPSNDFNEEPYFKWVVGFPEPESPIVSDSFTCQRVKRRLKLTTHPNPYKTDWVSLYIISEDDDFQPHEITVFIEAPTNTTVFFARVYVINSIQEITSYNQKEVRDYMREFKWNSVTFTCLFPGQTDLKISKGIQNSHCNRDQSEIEILSEDTGKLLDDPTDHNAVIECQGEFFYVHSEILESRCRQLAELLSRANPSSARLIPTKMKVDMDKESLRRILNFVYTGKSQWMAQLDVPSAERLRKAAQSCGLGFLVTKSEDILVKNLTNDNCLNILANAEEHSELKERVIVYVLDKRIPSMESWVSFRKNHEKLAFEVYHHFYLSHIN